VRSPKENIGEIKMLILKEFKIELNSKYEVAEEEVLSEPERKLHVMALCMRDALKAFEEEDYRRAYLEMLCVDSWAKEATEEFKRLSEEEE
jgi:glutamine synthetase